jgi:hypothetical protein
VDLRKAERDYSPSTMYRDYAINRTLFHWESQARQTPEQPTVQRYINHQAEGTRVLLFVRESKRFALGTQPFYSSVQSATSITEESALFRSPGGSREPCRRSSSRSRGASRRRSRRGGRPRRSTPQIFAVPAFSPLGWSLSTKNRIRPASRRRYEQKLAISAVTTLRMGASRSQDSMSPDSTPPREAQPMSNGDRGGGGRA